MGCMCTNTYPSRHLYIAFSNYQIIWKVWKILGLYNSKTNKNILYYDYFYFVWPYSNFFYILLQDSAYKLKHPSLP